MLKKKDDFDRSTLNSFDGPFQLQHADIGNLEFLRKFATDQKYCLLFVDLFTSNVYVYPMKPRKSILNKVEIFYKEIEGKRKVKGAYIKYVGGRRVRRARRFYKLETIKLNISWLSNFFRKYFIVLSSVLVFYLRLTCSSISG